MENLRRLRDELRRLDWAVACFPFTFKKQNYFVLVQRYVPPAVPPKFQLVYITFVDRQNTNRTLSGPANTKRIDVALKEVREFFGIAWSNSPGDLMYWFYKQFGANIPGVVPLTLSAEEQAMIIDQLDKSDSENPGKRFCYAVRRNGSRKGKEPGKRSPFNSQKTQMLRPKLYSYFEADRNLSFLYSFYQRDEQTDEQILDGFATR